MEAVNVHIDVYSAQTGITKFLELNRESGWLYDKTENLLPNSTHILQFTHLLVEADSENDMRLKNLKFSHQILYTVKAFDRIAFEKISKFIYMPAIKLSTKIFVLKKV